MKGTGRKMAKSDIKTGKLLTAEKTRRRARTDPLIGILGKDNYRKIAKNEGAMKGVRAIFAEIDKIAKEILSRQELIYSCSQQGILSDLAHKHGKTFNYCRQAGIPLVQLTYKHMDKLVKESRGRPRKIVTEETTVAELTAAGLNPKEITYLGLKELKNKNLNWFFVSVDSKIETFLKGEVKTLKGQEKAWLIDLFIRRVLQEENVKWFDAFAKHGIDLESIITKYIERRLDKKAGR